MRVLSALERAARSGRTCSMTEPTPKTRTLTSSWYTTSQACGPAGTSQQRPLTQMRSFITEGSETKVHACSWSNRSRCQRAEYLKPNGSEPEAAHRTIRLSHKNTAVSGHRVCVPVKRSPNMC